MLHLIVYSLLIFLTLLAVCDFIASCVKTSDGNKKRFILWSGPYNLAKNRLKGIRTLKEEVDPAAKPPTISETV